MMWNKTTKVLKTTLIIKRLNVVKGLNWASTAPLNAMQRMVTKNSKVICMAVSSVPINNTMAAAEPKQLWPMIAMVENVGD